MIVALILLTSCVTSSDIGATNTATIPPAITPGSALTPRIEFTVTPSAQVLATATLQFGPSEPEVVQRCPAHAQITLQDLSLSPYSRLIVRSAIESAEGLKLIDGNNFTPIDIPRTTKIDFEAISPDHKWFAFYRWQEATQDVELWISSIDGRDQWRAAEHIEFPSSADWVSDDLIGVYQDVPIGTVDPFNKVWQPLPDPAVNVAIQSNTSHLSPDGRAMIFVGSDSSGNAWYLLDYENLKLHKLFPWIVLDEQESSYIVPRTSVRWSPGGLSILVERRYGIDLASNIAVSRANDTNTLVSRVVLPGEGLQTNIIAWSDNSSLLALVRYDLQMGRNGPNQLYVLNADANTLYDYCFDRQRIFSYGGISPDNRFMAWTLFADEAGSAQRQIVVLDLATGLYAELEGMEFVAWGDM
jgi:hypothetical protein